MSTPVLRYSTQHMAGIIPIPTIRVGDLFVRQRLTEQVQRDQLALFRLQNQVSTGRRIQLPSEDAPAALRAINLQRLISRKGQAQTNLKASVGYLSAAEKRLTTVTDGLIGLRGEVVSVSGNTAPEAARVAAAQSVNSLLQELVNAGNAKFQGRHLFAGSRAQSQPYDYNGDFVEYSGNEGTLRSYVDLQRLFETNVPGTDVFGGISAQVEGSADLNPHLTTDTLVSTLNGGNGIGANAAIKLSVTDGTSTESFVVDLSKAVTIGDVARLIEDAAPETAGLRVEVGGTGLNLSTDGDDISISEVEEGRTAQMLGILSDPNVLPTSTITGLDLNPAMLKTTRLTNLLGTKSQGVIESSGANNDIQITANTNGAAFNNVNVEFIAGGVAGAEVVTFAGNTLTVEVQAGVSTASQVAAAITAQGIFTATVDDHDALSSGQAGTDPVEVTTFNNVTTGGGGTVLDTASGFILTNGGDSATIDLSAAVTVEDLLNEINGADLGLVAEINAAANGINIRSRLSGADFTIGENGGLTATQLGIRTYTLDTELAAFNRGIGVPTNIIPTNDDLLITARDGTQLSINLSGATTVDDVLDRINNHPLNGGLPKPITAQLATTGNGIELVDGTVGVQDLTVATVDGSRAAEFLGFVPSGQTQVSSATGVLQSEDRHTLETDSVFNTLLRLRTALETNNTEEIGRSLDRLDVDIERVTFAQADIGNRLQNLDVIEVRLEDENVQLQSALAEDLDVDLVEAISQLTARQYAFEASLRSAASLMQLSLLNFL